jgi:hypothetical protein
MNKFDSTCCSWRGSEWRVAVTGSCFLCVAPALDELTRLQPKLECHPGHHQQTHSCKLLNLRSSSRKHGLSCSCSLAAALCLRGMLTERDRHHRNIPRHDHCNRKFDPYTDRICLNNNTNGYGQSSVDILRHNRAVPNGRLRILHGFCVPCWQPNSWSPDRSSWLGVPSRRSPSDILPRECRGR